MWGLQCRASAIVRAPKRCSGPGGCSDCEGAWGCSWGCSDCGSSWGGSEAAATAAARLGLQLASVVAASSCRRRLVAVVASSPRRYPSPPLTLSSPVSSPVVAAPSSRRPVIPPRLYPHRQPVRAPCRSSLCGRRVVVAVARKTIFSKYHYEFTCHVLHPKSTALFTPPFTAFGGSLDLWKSRLNRNRTAGLLAVCAAEVAGPGPATPWHASRFPAPCHHPTGKPSQRSE